MQYYDPTRTMTHLPTHANVPDGVEQLLRRIKYNTFRKPLQTSISLTNKKEKNIMTKI